MADVIKTPEEIKAEKAAAKKAEKAAKKETGAGEEEEVVEIKKTDFNKLMSQLEQQSKDISLLYKAADRERLSKEMEKEGAGLIKQVRIWTWDNTGRVIIGWKLLTNRCEVVMGRWTEEQTVSLVLEDGETLTVPYLEFVRKTLNKIPADILGKTEEYDSEDKKITVFKVQFPNGKTLKINSLFVN
jgi:hypothetical protein